MKTVQLISEWKVSITLSRAFSIELVNWSNWGKICGKSRCGNFLVDLNLKKLFYSTQKFSQGKRDSH